MIAPPAPWMVARYSLLALPLAAMGLPFYIYAPTWLAENQGYGYAVVGLLFLLARLTDILTDIPVGIWSQPPKRQLVSMLVGTTILAFMAYCLLGLSHPLPAVALGLILIILFLGWTMITIPWMALPVRLARNDKDRLALNAGRELVLLFATLIALITPTFLDSNGVEIACVIAILGMYLCVLIQPRASIATKPTGDADSPTQTTINTLDLLAEPRVRRLVIPWFLNTLANTLPGTVLIIFARDVLGAKPELVGIALGVYFLSAIIGAPAIYWLARMVSPVKLWFLSVFWVAITYPILGFVGEGDGTIFLIVSLATGLVLAADQVVPTTLQTALAQDISTQHGGAEVNTRLFALWSLLTKAAMGIGVALGFIWLGANVREATPSPSSVVMVYVWIPVVLKLLALPFIWRLRAEK